MAAKQKAGTAVTKGPGTAVANWEEQMAAEAAVATKVLAGVGVGQFFSVRGGVLSFDGNKVPHSKMGVVIVGMILENAYYQEDFDPDAPAPPDCFAFGLDADTMAPHEIVIEKQDEGQGCLKCQWNQWGTADKGKGKACKNMVRLALLPAGNYDKPGEEFNLIEDVDHYATAKIAYLRVPVTSIRGYAAYVRQLDAVAKRAPHYVASMIKAEPHTKNQVEVSFSLIDKFGADIGPTLKGRHDEAMKAIDFPYQAKTDDEKKPAAKAKPSKFRR